MSDELFLLLMTHISQQLTKITFIPYFFNFIPYFLWFDAFDKLRY